MATLLSTYTTSRDNNFNLIRFIAALLVLYSHSFALAIGSGDAEPLRATIGMTAGSIAVDIFFVTSGFLITSSYLARNNIIAFIWARILRIYPALLVAVIFCILFIGLWFTKYDTSEYLTHTQTYKFLLKNTTLFFGIEYKLPGVFHDVPWKNAVNGSLWTLPYEVKMYAVLAIVLTLTVFIGKWISSVTFNSVLLLTGLLSIVFHIYNHFYSILPVIFVRLFSMFFIGAAFYAYRESVLLSSRLFFVLLTLLMVSTISKDVFFIFYSLFLPYLIFYVVYVPSGGVRKFNSIGDYSYGLYIYAFPVQQSIAALIPGVTVATMIAYSFSITFILSILSWHLIEKRFLKMKESYVFIERFIQGNRLVRRFIRTK